MEEKQSVQRVDPDYAGGSIVNLIAGVAAHFGLDTGHPPPTMHLPLTGADAVVLVIVDALGYRQFERHLASGNLPLIASFLRRGEATTAIATSTFPSTTAAALTTFHTGCAPCEHGFLGYTTWLSREKAVAEMIHFTNLTRGKPLANPRRLMAVPSIYTRLASLGVTCRAVIPVSIRHSLLSQWHFEGAEIVPYETPTSLPSVVSDAFDGSGQRYVVAYWPGYDTICHAYGPSSQHAADEAAAIDLTIGRLVARLPRTGRTALLLTADHGQRDLGPAEAIALDKDPNFIAWLASPPMGERCGRYLRVRPRSERQVVECLSAVADVSPMADAWATGLFGGQPSDPEFRLRTGDLLVIPRGRRQLLWSYSETQHAIAIRGGHGGWSDVEMLVPVIALRI